MGHGRLPAGSTARYYPFGDWRTEPTSNLTDRGFTGHKSNNLGTGAEDIGLIYMQARFYLPGIGRFASADTIISNPANPQSWNRYSYVRNSPLNFIDPTGHSEIAYDFGGGGLAAVGEDDRQEMGSVKRFDGVPGGGAYIPDSSSFVQKLVENVENLFWLLMQMTTSDGNNSQQVQSLGELGGHTSGSPGDFDPNDDDETGSSDDSGDDWWDDDDDYWDEQFGGDSHRPQRGNMPRNNQAQNRQFNGAVHEIEHQIGRDLSMNERRILHDSISNSGFGFREIVNEGLRLFGQ